VTISGETRERAGVAGAVGESPLRPDGIPKLKGEFEYAQDLHAEGMLWGATVRSPHARARLVSIDIAPALAIGGVHAVMTQGDVPGRAWFGLEHPDQPVLAADEVRFWGEPVAVVAADDLDTARRAAAAVVVEYEELEPLVDPEEAERSRRGVPADPHPAGRPGAPAGEVVVEGAYETGTQDPAPLGTEAGLAVPDGSGGVDIWGPTQWTHVDRRQLAACLGLRPGQVRVQPCGLGGAFGGREDLSLQTHVAMLALRLGRPVKMVYDRHESFVGHVKRHRAEMYYRHEADRDGRLVRVEARLLLDGGPYQLTSNAVVANSASFAVGPYRCDNVVVDAYVLRTNAPPAGAMRGFGANQPCFAYECQMDRLAAELGMDPLALRVRNALERGDDLATTGQHVEHPLPTSEVIRAVAAMPLPGRVMRIRVTCRAGPVSPPAGVAWSAAPGTPSGSRTSPSAKASTTTPRPACASPRRRRGAHRCGRGRAGPRHRPRSDRPDRDRDRAGRGGVRPHGQDRVRRSTSASRQTQMAGNAVIEAAGVVRSRALAAVGGDHLDDAGAWRDGEVVATLADW
jgi:CO/xanthine dehydrogenase Mo-binding subunit